MDKHYVYKLLVRIARHSDEEAAREFFEIHQIRPQGDLCLARVFSLVQFGDYLSCRLAAEAGVDPLPVERIETLKKNLKEGSKP